MIAISGSSIAICRISRRFFSPPEKPSFTYRETIAGSIRSSSSFCFKSFWNSPTGISSLSNPRRADTAVRRKLLMVTPGMLTGY